MSKRIVPLSDREVRTAKPQDKDYYLYDGMGLILKVTTKGGKLWRFKTTINCKEIQLALGSWPEVSLADAREKRAELRRTIAQGIDPRTSREQDAAVVRDTLESVGRAWHAAYRHTWTPDYAEILLQRLEKDIFPWIGNQPISQLAPREILTCLQRIWDRGAPDQAHRLRRMIGQIYRYAVAHGKAERDPTPDLKGALPPVIYNHHAAPTEPEAIAPLLRAIDTYQGTLVVRTALRLAPLLFVRPGELRHAEWSEIDLETALWSIPAEKMKMKIAHIVPLPSQAVTLLRELRPLTGSGRYLFPALRSPKSGRPMSENTINAALRYLGFEGDTIVGHGFRAMARTVLDEVLGVRPDIIEHQLAHVVRDPLGRAYNRTTHLEARRVMMQQWADYLDGLRSGAPLTP